MINHISIAVNEPDKVANFISELWDGNVYPFPPSPNSFIVVANDGRGSAVEVTPNGTILVPGEGLPDENDLNAATEEFEAPTAERLRDAAGLSRNTKPLGCGCIRLRLLHDFFSNHPVAVFDRKSDYGHASRRRKNHRI